MKIVSLICLAIILVICIFGLIINNHDAYCFVFEHRQWKLWQGFIKNASQFQYVGRFDNVADEYAWYDLFGNIRYRALVWDEPFGNRGGLCTIHQGSDCVLCNFDTKNSNTMANILKYNK